MNPARKDLKKLRMTETERSKRDLNHEYKLIYDAINSTLDRLPRLQKHVQEKVELLMRLSFRLGSLYKILEQIWFKQEE